VSRIGPLRGLFPTPKLCVVLTTLAACGGGDLTLPVDGSPASLRPVSGSGQQGTVGTRLPEPLVVRLVNEAARPVPNVAVDFRFQSDVPGAQFEPATVTTNDTGFAWVEVRLGSTPGPQTIEATVGVNPSSDLLVTFAVTAVASNNGGEAHPGKGKKDGKGKDHHED
jgi:hypothetical protein